MCKWSKAILDKADLTTNKLPNIQFIYQLLNTLPQNAHKKNLVITNKIFNIEQHRDTVKDLLKTNRVYNLDVYKLVKQRTGNIQGLLNKIDEYYQHIDFKCFFNFTNNNKRNKRLNFIRNLKSSLLQYKVIGNSNSSFRMIMENMQSADNKLKKIFQEIVTFLIDHDKKFINLQSRYKYFRNLENNSWQTKSYLHSKCNKFFFSLLYELQITTKMLAKYVAENNIDKLYTLVKSLEEDLKWIKNVKYPTKAMYIRFEEIFRMHLHLVANNLMIESHAEQSDLEKILKNLVLALTIIGLIILAMRCINSWSNTNSDEHNLQNESLTYINSLNKSLDKMYRICN